MHTPAVYVQSDQNRDDLILHIKSVTITDEAAMDRFFGMADKSGTWKSLQKVASRSAEARRAYEVSAQLPRGALDFVAFCGDAGYIARLTAIHDEYRETGTLKGNATATFDVIAEAGEQYEELLPFMIRAKASILPNPHVIGSDKQFKAIPTQAANNVNIGININLAINALAAVNVEGYTNVHQAVHVWTWAVVVSDEALWTSTQFWLGGE